MRRLSARSRRIAIVSTVLVATLATYVAIDLFAPRQHDIRRFDPDDVARIETAMWRSYYARERLALFLQLGALLRSQYDLPFVRSYVVGYRAARAAFVFKDGTNRSDYERALPDLVQYYEALRKVGTTPFDAHEVARLELEWWIVHRERATLGRDALVRSLADLPSAIYGIPRERLMEHARLRAEAMTIRDTKAEQGGVSEADWAKIDELLHQSWRSLHAEVSRD